MRCSEVRNSRRRPIGHSTHSVADDRTICVNRAVTKPCIFMQREGVEHVSSIHNCSGKRYSTGLYRRRCVDVSGYHPAGDRRRTEVTSLVGDHPTVLTSSTARPKLQSTAPLRCRCCHHAHCWPIEVH